jgi:hypothetical protein
MKYVLSQNGFSNCEPKVRLFLQREGDTVDLMAQKEGCSPFYILTFHKSGVIRRVENVPEDIGFAVDSKGRIEIE